MTSLDKKLSRRAIDSQGLQGRNEANRQFGSSDFPGWVRGVLQSLSFSSVVDICCGTGDQLVLYKDRPELERLVGVDLSEDSLKIARERLNEKADASQTSLLAEQMDKVFSSTDLADKKFDLISCFYGLYYSNDTARLLREFVEHLNPGGSILVVGPYGENNRSLFQLLEKHIAIPELVTHSSTIFMTGDVLPTLQNCLDVHTETFVNSIRYPSVESVIEYWRASTFYDETREEDVIGDLKAHFERADEFTVTKHVMAAIGRRRD